MIDRSDTEWYRDAIIYQLHVKSFFDSNDDGVGDFEGVTRKLDYIKDLGVSAIWVMPFYPSPLRDDGYDIADYRGDQPELRRRCGTSAGSCRRPMSAACGSSPSSSSTTPPTSIPGSRRRGRRKPGSAARDFYVWSDTDQKYKDTRIIFLDTEPSNWSWDPVAKAYYWHRFYSHQPDLNFDNPRVLEGVLDVMRYWLDMGVDGLRLDAIPYLIEREGTNCENLPETHAVIKKIRAALDAGYPGPDAAGRSQPMAGGDGAVFRRGRRMPYGVPLPAHAAHVHGARARGPASRSPTSCGRRRRSPRAANGRSSCAITTS